VFHLTTAFLEDADGLFITPIVNDPFEKIVSPLGTDLKKRLRQNRSAARVPRFRSVAAPRMRYGGDLSVHPRSLGLLLRTAARRLPLLPPTPTIVPEDEKSYAAMMAGRTIEATLAMARSKILASSECAPTSLIHCDFSPSSNSAGITTRRGKRSSTASRLALPLSIT
jgi:hypothetical protein